MIAISNRTAQTIPVGQSLVFDTTIMQTGCDCCRRGNQTFAKIKNRGNYILSFGGNIGATTETTDVQIAIQIGGQTLPETTMISTSEAAGDLNHVSVMTPFRVCCSEYTRVSITNTGLVPVNIDANAVLAIIPI